MSFIPLLFPPQTTIVGSTDFLRGLGVKDLPSGVTESCDYDDVVAWEVTLDARVSASLADVLRRGYNPQPPTSAPRLPLPPPTLYTFGGDYSFELRLRPWVESATVLAVYDGIGNERLRLSVGQHGAFIRLQSGLGNLPDTLRVANVNVTGPGFTRLSFNVVGGQVQVKVNCSPPVVVTPLPAPVDTAAERQFEVNGALVVLGRPGETGLVVSFSLSAPPTIFYFIFLV